MSNVSKNIVWWFYFFFCCATEPYIVQHASMMSFRILVVISVHVILEIRDGVQRVAQMKIVKLEIIDQINSQYIVHILIQKNLFQNCFITFLIP